jgi:hypothetical protein
MVQFVRASIDLDLRQATSSRVDKEVIAVPE